MYGNNKEFFMCASNLCKMCKNLENLILRSNIMQAHKWYALFTLWISDFWTVLYRSTTANITTLCHWFLHVPQWVCTPAFAGTPDIGIVEEICEVCRHISLQKLSVRATNSFMRCHKSAENITNILFTLLLGRCSQYHTKQDASSTIKLSLNFVRC